VASAWLIRRSSIARRAFGGSPNPQTAQRARSASTSTGHIHHVDDHVTFETLMASFGLDSDPALASLAAMVHQLDVEVSRSLRPGVRSGSRRSTERTPDDDALLAEISVVLDSLYAHFGREAARAKT